MTFKQLLILLIAVTALLWAGWVWTLFSIDPLTTNWLGFLLFYLTLFLALTGALTVGAVIVRKWRQPEVLDFHAVGRSLRQAIALSIFALALLILQGMRALRWYNILVLVVVVVGLETFILRRQERRRPVVSGLPPVNMDDDSPQPLFIRREMGEDPTTNDPQQSANGY